MVRVLYFIVPLLVGSPAVSQIVNAGDDKPIVPPAEFRPPNFSHLIGKFSIEASLTPAEISLEKPAELKVTITGSGSNKDYLPNRDSLEIFPPSLKEDFFIGDLSEKDIVDPKNNRWVFHWRLLPKHENVDTFPVLELWYYDDGSGSGLPGQYGVSFSEPISLKLRREPKVLAAPEQMYKLVTGEQVLQRGPSFPIRWLAVILALVLPPAGSLLYYGVWRHRYPREAELAKRRRNRAAAEALRRLHRLRSDANGEKISMHLSHYLQSRWEFPANEPTPAESRDHLLGAGLPSELAQQVADFFSAAYEGRFAPAHRRANSPVEEEAVRPKPLENSHLKEAAIRLILSIEEASS